MPLSASLGGIVVLARESEKGKDYTCKHCKSEMILKKGEIKIPHFAHKVLQPHCKSSGETEEHIEMKNHIGELLGCSAKDYEVKIGNTEYDVKKDDVVIECQASSIEPKEIEQRNRNAKIHGLKMLWVFSNSDYGEIIHKGRGELIKLKSAEMIVMEIQPLLYFDMGESILYYLEPTKRKFMKGGGLCKTQYFFRGLRKIKTKDDLLSIFNVDYIPPSKYWTLEKASCIVIEADDIIDSARYYAEEIEERGNEKYDELITKAYDSRIDGEKVKDIIRKFDEEKRKLVIIQNEVYAVTSKRDALLLEISSLERKRNSLLKEDYTDEKHGEWKCGGCGKRTWCKDQPIILECQCGGRYRKIY